MRSVTTVLVSLAAVPVFLLGTGRDAVAQDGRKPLLSGEIGRVLRVDGTEAAERRFKEIYPAETDHYEVDLNGMTMLAAAQIQANDMVAAEAVFRMVGVLQEGELAKYMPDAAAAAREEQEAVQREEAKRAVRTAGRFRGTSTSSRPVTVFWWPRRCGPMCRPGS